MKNEPLISVIVPVYNVESYIDRCIKSVLSQTYSNFELILIDDGSKDNSNKICKDYSDKDNRVVVIHQDNQGRSCARNKGIQESKGEYIAFLDSDDYYDNAYLKDMYDLIETYDADISCCRYEKVNDDSTINNLNNKSNNNLQIYENYDILKEYFHNVKSDIYPNIWTRLYKKSLFDNVRFETSEFEDLFIIYKLLNKATKMVCTDNKYYLYNVANMNSVTRKINNLDRVHERIKYINEISKYYANTQEIRNELIYHLMEQKITILNDIRNSKTNAKDLLKIKKDIRHWISTNINNSIFSSKDKTKIIIRVYFHNIWSLYKKI